MTEESGALVSCYKNSFAGTSPELPFGEGAPTWVPRICGWVLRPPRPTELVLTMSKPRDVPPRSWHSLSLASQGGPCVVRCWP